MAQSVKTLHTKALTIPHWELGRKETDEPKRNRKNRYADQNDQEGCSGIETTFGEDPSRRPERSTNPCVGEDAGNQHQ
jgi:hypothetical protein